MLMLRLRLNLTLNAIFGHSKKIIRVLLAMRAEPSPGTGTYPPLCQGHCAHRHRCFGRCSVPFHRKLVKMAHP